MSCSFDIIKSYSSLVCACLYVKFCIYMLNVFILLLDKQDLLEHLFSESVEL